MAHHDKQSYADTGGARGEVYQVRFQADDGTWRRETRIRIDPHPLARTARGASGQAAASSNPAAPGSSAGGASKNAPHGIANKEYVEREHCVLEGECALVPCAETSKIKAGDTVRLFGLGKHLSGCYAVEEVMRSIDGSGYSLTVALRKNGFGDGAGARAEEKDGRPAPAPMETGERLYVAQAGDTLWDVARRECGDGALYARLAERNGLPPSQFMQLPLGKELVVS